MNSSRPPEPPDQTLVLYSDGASRGNPGPAGAGALLISPTGSVLKEISEYLGTTTNNQAEYLALILALRAATTSRPRKLIIRLDSELVAKQLRGEYRVRDPQLKPLFDQAKELLGSLDSVQIQHVPREQNARADRLANAAIDRVRKAT